MSSLVRCCPEMLQSASDRTCHLALVPTAQPEPHVVSEELPPDVSVGRIAEFGALIGDPARIAMLVALLNEDGLPASTLAARAGVTPQTASGHLGRLVAGGLVMASVVGRQRLHSFASDEVRRIVRQLYVAGSSINRSTRPAVTTIRIARDCSGHIAGRLATELAERLVHVVDRDHPELRVTAIAALRLFGVEVQVHEQVSLCRDWTECRPHLGGRLGQRILERSLTLGWLKRNAGSSALTLTPGGVEGFRNRFGVVLGTAA